MTYQVTYWAADGNGEAEIRHIRIKKADDAKSLAEPQNRPSDCVRVTLDRTDKQSPVYRDLWIKPNYKSPF